MKQVRQIKNCRSHWLAAAIFICSVRDKLPSVGVRKRPSDKVAAFLKS